MKPSATIMVLRYKENSRGNSLIPLFLLPNFLPVQESLGDMIHRGQPHLSRMQGRSERAIKWTRGGWAIEEEPAHFLISVILEYKFHQGWECPSPDHS